MSEFPDDWSRDDARTWRSRARDITGSWQHVVIAAVAVAVLAASGAAAGWLYAAAHAAPAPVAVHRGQSAPPLKLDGPLGRWLTGRPQAPVTPVPLPPDSGLRQLFEGMDQWSDGTREPAVRNP